MKRIILLIIFAFVFTPSALAQGANQAANSAIQPTPTSRPLDKNGDDGTDVPYDADYDKQDSDDFYNELIEQQYGSNQSADFNGHSEMNPDEANYGYQSPAY